MDRTDGETPGYDARSLASGLPEVNWILASVPAQAAPRATALFPCGVAAAPLIPFDPELTALIDEKFGNPLLRNIKVTLSDVLHSKGYVLLSDLAKIGSACRGRRSNPLEQLLGADVELIEHLLCHLCKSNVNHKTWDRLSDFFIAALEKTIGATPSAPVKDDTPLPGSRADCVTHLHRAISLRATSAKDARDTAFWSAVHHAYFGNSDEPLLLLTRGDLITDAPPYNVICSWPGCAHKNPYSWHFPSKSCFDTLFGHLLSSHFTAEKRPAPVSDVEQASSKRTAGQRTITEVIRPRTMTPAAAQQQIIASTPNPKTPQQHL